MCDLWQNRASGDWSGSGIGCASTQSISWHSWGFTLGTGGDIFSPGEAVSRWEMALFMVRFLEAAEVPPSTLLAARAFDDLTQLNPETAVTIDQLSLRSALQREPARRRSSRNDAVARWQMALFLTWVMAVDGIVPS